MNGQQGLSKVEDFGEMKGGVGGIADSNNGGWEQGGDGDEIVVRRRRGLRGAEGTDVYDGALKFPAGFFFFDFIGRGREQAEDFARTAPSDDVVRLAAGA